MSNTEKKIILLKGEGIHQHVLHGEFRFKTDYLSENGGEVVTDFAEYEVIKECKLRHEKPSGDFSNEHKTLPVSAGNYVMGKQVEYNPFTGELSRIWD